MADLTLSESEFEIERIIKHRKKGRKNEYLIRWRGYESDEDEWVKEENIEAKGLIKDYEQSLKPATRKVATRIPKVKSSRTASAEVVVTKSSRRTAVQSSTIQSNFDSETSDVETPLTTRTVHTETTVWRSDGYGGEEEEEEDDEEDNVDYHEQIVKQSQTSSSSNTSSHPKRASFPFSRQDIPLLIFICCELFIVLSFVVEA